MSEISSRAALSLNFSGGNFQLRRAKSAKVKFDADAEVVLAIGVDGGAGFRDKTGGGEMTLEVYSEDGKPEVDYFKLWATRERFGSAIKFKESGSRYQFRSCRVTTPPEIAIDTEGNNMLSVTIKFLQFGAI